MSLDIALSGLNAANTDLNTISNNIANANTTGFKQSRAEFGDFFRYDSYGVDQLAGGSGVQTKQIQQQFTQGMINTTGNNLDMAISGSNDPVFFAIAPREMGPQNCVSTNERAARRDYANRLIKNRKTEQALSDLLLRNSTGITVPGATDATDKIATANFTACFPSPVNTTQLIPGNRKTLAIEQPSKYNAVATK